MLNFFVQDVPEMRDIYRMLKFCNFKTRRKGVATQGEIAFFYSGGKKGFSFSAHKLIKEKVPDCCRETPFLISVGERWTKRGLITVIEGYTRFFKRSLPVVCYDYMTEEQILNVAKACVILPWGGFPQGEEAKLDLIVWLEWANRAIPKKEHYPFLISSTKLTVSR